MSWLGGFRDRVADRVATYATPLLVQLATQITDLTSELTAVRTDAQVEYRLRLEAEREKDNLAASNRALTQARDENSTLITKLRDRVFELEAHCNWVSKRCDVCENAMTANGPMLGGIVIRVGLHTAHLSCLTRLVEGVLSTRPRLFSTYPLPDSPPTPPLDVREHLDPDADAPTPD